MVHHLGAPCSTYAPPERRLSDWSNHVTNRSKRDHKASSDVRLCRLTPLDYNGGAETPDPARRFRTTVKKSRTRLIAVEEVIVTFGALLLIRKYDLTSPNVGWRRLHLVWQPNRRPNRSGRHGMETSSWCCDCRAYVCFRCPRRGGSTRRT